MRCICTHCLQISYRMHIHRLYQNTRSQHTYRVMHAPFCTCINVCIYMITYDIGCTKAQVVQTLTHPIFAWKISFCGNSNITQLRKTFYVFLKNTVFPIDFHGPQFSIVFLANCGHTGYSYGMLYASNVGGAWVSRGANASAPHLTPTLQRSRRRVVGTGTLEGSSNSCPSSSMATRQSFVILMMFDRNHGDLYIYILYAIIICFFISLLSYNYFI